MSYEAWGEPPEEPELPDGWLDEEGAYELQENVANLALLVQQLAYALRKANPIHVLPERAMDYLQREGLCGSPLRSELTPNVETKAAAEGSPRLSAELDGTEEA